MAVLVTGGAGYIGSHMVWDLVDRGERVVVLDRLITGFAWAVAPEAELIVGDIANYALVSQVLRDRKVEAVIHFAGSIIVPESVTDPLSYYENNTCKTRALMQAVVDVGVPHFIFSSTAAVYGNQGAEPIGEQAATIPESPYGRSKLMTEWMLADASRAHGFRYTALRYFNVAGADPKGRTGQSTPLATHLIKVACEAATGKRPFIEVYGTDYETPDGTCIRDYIHVSDLVEVHRLALERLRSGAPNLIANCGYGTGRSVRQVIDAVKRISGKDFAVRLSGRRAGDPVAIVARGDLARREFGWSPKRDSLEVIVADALAWEQRLSQRNAR